MMARYQDPNRGQFLSEDPASRDNPSQFLEDPQQMNSYSYARNNPIVNKDPDGKQIAEALTAPIWGPVIVGSAVGLYYTTRNLSRNYGSRWAGTRQTPDMSKYLDISGEGGGPLPENKNAPKWQQVARKIIAGGTITSTVYCVSQGFEDCVAKVENTSGSNSNAMQGSSSKGNDQTSSEGHTAPNVSTYAHMSYQEVRNVAQSYNSRIAPGFSAGSHSGGSSLAGTHWVTPSGAVVTWEGKLVSGPTSK